MKRTIHFGKHAAVCLFMFILHFFDLVSSPGAICMGLDRSSGDYAAALDHEATKTWSLFKNFPRFALPHSQETVYRGAR